MHLYKYTLCVSLPDPSPVWGSVSSSLLLMKTVVFSNTWVTCFLSQSCSIPHLFFALLTQVLSRPAVPLMWAEGGGLFRCGNRCCCHSASDVCVHLQPGAGAPSESPVFRAWRWIEGLLTELGCEGPAVSPSPYAEAGLYGGPGRLPAGEERGWLKGSYTTLAHALTTGGHLTWCNHLCVHV